jgi:hypothetical protein
VTLAAVPPSGSDFQKQMCIVVRKKNCVCVCAVVLSK